MAPSQTGHSPDFVQILVDFSKRMCYNIEQDF